MNKRKKYIRGIMLDIIFSKPEQSDDPVQSVGHLKRRVTELLHPQDEESKASASITALAFGHITGEPELSDEDWVFFSEVYWDLFFERIITPGLDSSNPQFEWFRIHSESPLQRKN